jgi:hypothetical protein
MSNKICMFRIYNNVIKSSKYFEIIYKHTLQYQLDLGGKNLLTIHDP